MIHKKTEYSQLDAPFAEKKKDIENGDLVEILSEGVSRPNRFDTTKEQTIIKIKTKNGARYLTLNPKSADILIDEFKSADDKDWIGKTAKVLLNPTTIGGKRVIVAYLAGPSYELDEFGEPVNPGAQPDPNADIPTINLEQDEVNVEDVPF